MPNPTKKPTAPKKAAAGKALAAKKPAAANKPAAAKKLEAANKLEATKKPAVAAQAKSGDTVAARAPGGGVPGLSAKEVAAIRAELEAQQDTLTQEWKDLEQGSFNLSQSELSGEVSFDEEYADAGTFTFERERDLSLGNNIQDLLEKVKIALHKLDEKTYGRCERCGRTIDKIRLKALPYSALCIQCKQQEERVR